MYSSLKILFSGYNNRLVRNMIIVNCLNLKSIGLRQFTFFKNPKFWSINYFHLSSKTNPLRIVHITKYFFFHRLFLVLAVIFLVIEYYILQRRK